ncbi:hypothetical protein KQH42_07310 [Streptomyces sp. CHA1]|uniref:hypothetical protein n=1 Tax=Streptomyces TaxID=1883 RepID=UPI001BFC6EC9|nr:MULTISPECIES: hypothetical protein [unclassified Streptomyces]MBT3157352.1 hypothetical protein [Streptomyces sp. G11C]MCO6700323.1 hypothetical protein [Streptomyces sp. CHB9.2]MCO6706459.1 hypothetical protein [Streptomyces sp. CHA3]MCO6712201.1 hypothetical protein [Streptomyces sp. CHB19.2]MCO6718635.1 hypothetical protein [Streptomyces sp. Vc714c-19]
MPRVYATPEQLAAWTGQPAPADAERLLARASEDVDAALLCAFYSTNSAGMPTDPRVVQALADAVCAQVEYQQETGDTGTGAAGRWGSVSIGPVSLGDRRDDTQAATGLDLAPRAHRALMAAGLLPGVIW